MHGSCPRDKAASWYPPQWVQVKWHASQCCPSFCCCNSGCFWPCCSPLRSPLGCQAFQPNFSVRCWGALSQENELNVDLLGGVAWKYSMGSRHRTMSTKYPTQQESLQGNAYVSFSHFFFSNHCCFYDFSCLFQCTVTGYLYIPKFYLMPLRKVSNFSEHLSQSIHVLGFCAAEGVSVLENSWHWDLRNNRKCSALMMLAAAFPGSSIDMSISESFQIEVFPHSSYERWDKRADVPSCTLQRHWSELPGMRDACVVWVLAGVSFGWWWRTRTSTESNGRKVQPHAQSSVVIVVLLQYSPVLQSE